jgi:hypothetical protein
MSHREKNEDVENNKQMLRHHKDSMQRYTNVDWAADRDHYLCAEDGKLKLLRVQMVSGYKQPTLGKFDRTWSLPRDVNGFQSLWRSAQNAPRGIVRWTFSDGVKSKNGTFHQAAPGFPCGLTIPRNRHREDKNVPQISCRMCRPDSHRMYCFLPRKSSRSMVAVLMQGKRS